MIKEAIATGRTVEDAIDRACEMIELPRSDVDFEIIDMPSKGILGFGQKLAKVRVYVEVEDQLEKEFGKPAEQKAETSTTTTTPKAEVAEEVKNYDFKNKAASTIKYLEDILSKMNIPNVSVSHTIQGETLMLKIENDTAGISIGRRGDTLDAIQYLLGVMSNREDGDYMRVVLDCGNYREKRKATLEQLATKIANNVKSSGRSTTLEPMNPYERRIIHSTISDIEGVNSSSIGQEPNRCVIISSTTPRAGGTGGKPPYRSNNNNRSGGKPPYRSNNNRGGAPRNDSRGPRREKPEPYKASSQRDVAPAEATNKPLYGKVEI